MNILLAVLIIVLLFISYELWKLIEILQKHFRLKNPLFDFDSIEPIKYADPDPLYDEAVKVVSEFGKASASLIQRRLSIGYARAAHILDLMEKEGVVGPADGVKPRDVKLSNYGKDPLFSNAVDVIHAAGKASPALLQRKLSMGYARAAKIMDQLEADGYIGPPDGAKPRDVLK